MHDLIITTIFAAIFAVVTIPLSLQITARRIALGNVAIGDANDNELRIKRETLGNFSEYVPLGLIMLALFEYHFGQIMYVWIYASVFLVSRVVHLLGMLYSTNPLPRAIAMMSQHIAFFLVACALIYKVAM